MKVWTGLKPISHSTRPAASGTLNQYAPLYKGRKPDSSNASLAEKAYEYILSKIVFPDDVNESGIEYAGKITEAKIAQSLKISNGPVREAIYRLRHEGWIRTVGNRGSYLNDFTDPSRSVDIYRFRLNIETGAFYSLAASITDEQIRVLYAILEDIEDARAKMDIMAFREADIRFHLQVVEFAGGPLYAQLFRSKLMQWYAMSFHVLTESIGAEQYRYNLEATETPSHHALFDSLEAHDCNLAAKRITQHLSFIAHLLKIEQTQDSSIHNIGKNETRDC